MGKPAARMGDPTMHGGVIMAGYPTVLIGGMPAARLGDMHVCPMLNPGTPPPPHVGGPIALGSPLVLIGGMPAARMGDMATCAGPPDTIAMGCPTVMIGESPGSGGGGGGAAGAAKAGAHSALVGEPGPEAEGPHWIEYKFVDSAGNPITEIPYEFTNVDGHKEKGKLTKDGVVKRGGLHDSGSCTLKLFSITNVKWSRNSAKVGDTVKLSADVDGYENGTTAVLEIWEKDIDGADDFIAKIETSIKGNKVEAEWKYEYVEDTDETSLEDEKKGYSSPEYYFIVKVEEGHARSDLLKYKDWVEIKLKDEEGKPIGKVKYKLILPDGEIKKGTLDSDGKLKLEDIPPGKVKIEFEKGSLYKGISKKSK